MNDQERRRFVRIEGTLKVWFEVLSDASKTPEEETEHALEKTAQYALLDNQINTMLAALRHHSPKTTEVLHLLNKKMNLLFELAGIHHQDMDWLEVPVSLSACGVSFPINQALPDGQMVSFKMQIRLFNQVIETLARVVGCSPADEPGLHILRLDFVDLTSQQEDTLIQYIFQEEAAQLRKAKQNNNQAT